MSPAAAIAGRVAIAVVMGGVSFALALTLAAAVGLPLAGGLLMAALAGTGLMVACLPWSTASARLAWGRGCLVNGLLTAVMGVGIRLQGETWPDQFGYPNDLGRAIGSLNHFVWALAARTGLVALILATILFAISYWLRGPPHRKA